MSTEQHWSMLGCSSVSEGQDLQAVPRSLNADPNSDPNISGSLRIQRFTASGTFIAGFGVGRRFFLLLTLWVCLLMPAFQLGDQRGLAVHLVFCSMSGRLVMSFFVDSWAIEVVGEGSCSDLTCFWPAALAGNVSRPYGIAQMDTSNDLLVAEPLTQRIERCGAAISR